MSRPYDWSPLGLAGDPTPGDPVVVRSGGVHYQDVSGSLGRATATMEVMDAGVSSGSQSVAALLEGSVQLAAQIGKAKARYQAAGDALVNYSYALDRAQSATAQALATAKSAQWEVDENTRLAAQYRRWALDADTPEQAEDRARYQRLESARRLDVSDAQARITTQREVVAQAVRERDVAAELAVTQISEITGSDGLDDSWWDDWGAKVVAWITDLAEAIATIAGILALLVCWIPIIGQALAAVLTLVAAVAGIVAALGNIALAATGERSWGEAIISILGAALACVGLGALKGALGGLKGAMGAWKAAGGIAGQGGLAAVGLATLRSFTASVKGLATSLASKFGSRIRPPSTVVPPYGQLGKKTYGTLVRPDGSEVALVSGHHPPASLLGSTPGMNIVTKAHVEAHAAAIMRLDGLSEATLWINRAPCPGVRGCEYLLPRMVPNGAVMTIHVVPEGSLGSIASTIIVRGVG